MTIRLVDLATARSGDKGEKIDLGVFARSERGFAWMVQEVTEERVLAHFAPLGVTRVERWALPNLLALKLVLHGALPGGAARTLRGDNLGKTLGSAILRMEIAAPPGGEDPR
jgi:hypothetical protein